MTRIGSVSNNWIYAGFSKQQLMTSRNHVPMDVPMMEMKDTGGRAAFTSIAVVTSIGAREARTTQFKNETGYGNGTITKVTDTTTGLDLIVYTFETTTQPDSVGIDLVHDQLIPFVFRFDTSNGAINVLHDKVIGTPVVIFPIIPEQPVFDGTSAGKGSGQISWSWIVTALVVLLIFQ